MCIIYAAINNNAWAVNSHNVRARGQFLGVTLQKNGRWSAAICASGKTQRCGTYESPELAAMARDGMARILFGDEAKLNGCVVPDHYFDAETQRLVGPRCPIKPRKTSKYIGVCQVNGKWRAGLSVQGKIYTSLYNSEELAAMAYDEMVKSVCRDSKKINSVIVPGFKYDADTCKLIAI